MAAPPPPHVTDAIAATHVANTAIGTDNIQQNHPIPVPFSVPKNHNREGHMSTTPPLTLPSPFPSPCRRNLNKTIKPSSSFLKLLEFRFSKDRNQIRCELRSFEPSQKWTIDCVSRRDPIHIILKPPPAIPMASSAALDSTGKSSKKVAIGKKICLWIGFRAEYGFGSDPG
ncbi:hypothetical protein F0562_003538 [Nyssa sinensis]|uniref:Uncharacterized protein n=1 Tax=Nyssa sinensis TaxID=561372 RepID=A0A5J5BVT3_9ASTE|nr:hypothetical protein F0562_003538 [Nyssa sinensis]